MARRLKNIIFKMSIAQMLFSIFAIAATIVFFLARSLPTASASSSTSSPIFVLIMLTIFLLLTRLSIIVKVGIGFVPFILFPVQMIFGTLPALAMVAITTYIYLKIATRPTPIDFLITKGVQSSISQLVYISLWILSSIPLFRIYEISHIMANLTFIYMLSVGIYIVWMVIMLPIMAKEPIPMAIINGMMMVPIQFLFITYLGPRFFNYLLNVAGIAI